MADTPTTDAPATTTDGTTPPATTTTDAPATKDTSTDDTVVLKKSDHDALVRQRDQANEDLRKAREAGGDSEAFLAQLAQERHIDGFLKDHAKDYPDLNQEDLMHVTSPDDVEAEAKRLQRRFEDVSQKKLQEVQVVDQTPKLSAEDRATRESDLKKNTPVDAFEQMVNIRS